MNVLIILLTLVSIGVLAMAGPALSASTTDTGVSNSAIVFQNGKPVTQVTGPVGSTTNQTFDAGTYQYLDDAMNPHMVSHALVNWSFNNPYINMTFAEYLNGVFVKYEDISLNLTATE